MAVQQASPPTMTPEEQWPAVALAYEWARPSYEIMLKRFEMVEGRIRTLVTLAASLTFGAPVFATAARGPMSYTSVWLMAALSCAGFILIAGALGSIGRRVDVPDPSLLHATALDPECKTPWDFQHWALERTSEAWRTNRDRLEWKANLADWIAVALIVELALMVIWVVIS